MKKILLIMLLISKNYAIAQKTPEDFGYKQMSFKFQDDKVDLIVISKKGEEKIAKPLFFFCQGSLPRPVVIYDEKGLYGTLPFNETSFLDDFHIIIIAKPAIPIIANANILGKNFMYLKDKENEIPPKGYTDRNYLDYYVFRNNFILKQLSKERWVSKKKLVVAGHSEGSSIASKMAILYPKITHLIYSGGNPFGRIVNILSEERDKANTINYWKTVVENSAVINYNGGDTYKATYSFSLPQRQNLVQLKIPILVTYGSKDVAANYNDLFQIEIIRDRKQNFKFINYPDLEHNFFAVNEKLEPIYEKENWDKVAKDWLDWLHNSTN
ncbi:dienelactone hydrolase family protein [Flavobacterium psychrophilum]|uniref:dienelactone hydrolase family protein n=1 Tax=Flavobacterium psychrophilum TaxID=96345 RepID=UPI001C8F9903|nr:dienelactone hydrolase family protein [Flavobacterium psychrophilum]EKT4498389.1 dienelactone hydrolase family protein [Flavobacterium psychrophilum]ELM3649628.1 dienelactone hydrolase family protein [Flavobacterium psychrophilum]ELM3670324.1 dienelactone hydrolase family protein [Flavobacterium psychrophilum]ELM3725680.1 dienelactone hydrolase family protein [Flavobacterium psychrophilum]ELY1992227.1 dienelactone hydrolase family protein [Flavobacterium psychrophilum]